MTREKESLRVGEGGGMKDLLGAAFVRSGASSFPWGPGEEHLDVDLDSRPPTPNAEVILEKAPEEHKTSLWARG